LLSYLKREGTKTKVNEGVKSSFLCRLNNSFSFSFRPNTRIANMNTDNATDVGNSNQTSQETDPVQDPVFPRVEEFGSLP